MSVNNRKMYTNIHGDQECQFTKLRYFTVSTEEMGSAELKKRFSDVWRRNINRSKVLLDSTSFCSMLQISAELEKILCSWRRRFFLSQKWYKVIFWKENIADPQAITDWLNGVIKRPVRPENSLSATIYNLTLEASDGTCYWVLQNCPLFFFCFYIFMSLFFSQYSFAMFLSFTLYFSMRLFSLFLIFYPKTATISPGDSLACRISGGPTHLL